MTLTKLTLCLATLALGVASAASTYSITLTADTQAGNTKLKAGEYKVQVEGNQAIFKQGKTSTTIPVTVEKNATPYRFTSLESDASKLQAIDLGGTNWKIVFSPAQTTGSTTSAQ